MTVKIAIIGAGSQSFGPATVRDVLLSEALAEAGVELALMDIVPEHLPGITAYARRVAERLGRRVQVTAGTALDAALDGAQFVVSAIEVDRYRYWAQDFHVPRHYGFMQIYGENGGPGGLFHALRNMGPTLQIAHRMEALCPDAVLLNFTNPESKLCQVVNTLTDVQAYGLCHGVAMGEAQIAAFLQRPVGELEMAACGMNHISWFQTIRDRATGKDLYPLLRARERAAAPLAHWDELALSRICLRVFGLWPSPGANHIGEYIRWAGEFLASSLLQYYYDPVDGHPWETGEIPQFIYSLGQNPTAVPLFGVEEGGGDAVGDRGAERHGQRPAATESGAVGRPAAAEGGTVGRPAATEGGAVGRPAAAEGGTVGRPAAAEGGTVGRPATTEATEGGPAPEHPLDPEALRPSGELAVPIMEALACGVRHTLGAVIVPNRGAIPGLDDDIAVEVPAVADGSGVHPWQMARLPEPVTAILRTQGSIQKLLVDAYVEGSRRLLLQSLLLDPTAHSYRNAVALINEMCGLQEGLLPEMGW